MRKSLFRSKYNDNSSENYNQDLRNVQQKHLFLWVHEHVIINKNNKPSVLI
jgi:hypothetical protein